jgi:hypothetical protein
MSSAGGTYTPFAGRVRLRKVTRQREERVAPASWRAPAHCDADPAVRDKHLALLFLGRQVQSEILRSAPLRSE